MSLELPMADDQSIPRGASLLPPLVKPCTPSLLQQTYQCLCVAALALASYFLISHFVIQSVKIVGMSMCPTLYDQDHYLVNRRVYVTRQPQRADALVLPDAS